MSTKKQGLLTLLVIIVAGIGLAELFERMSDWAAKEAFEKMRRETPMAKVEGLGYVPVVGILITNYAPQAEEPKPYEPPLIHVTVPPFKLPSNVTASITLAWARSEDPEVVGYRIYYGCESKRYTEAFTVGEFTHGTLTNLLPGTVYYTAVTGYTKEGIESGYSEELRYQTP